MAPRYTRWEETVDIPEFHGGISSDSLLYWFEDVEEILEFQNVSEKRLVSLVVEKFRGQAKSWWRQVKITRERAGKSPIKSWDKLKQKLCATFLPHHMMYKRLPNPVRHGGNKREKKQPRVQHENKDVTTDFTNVVSALTDPIFLNNWKLMINQREEPIKVPREEGDHVVIVENPSPEEEVEEEEEVPVVKDAEQKDIQDDHNLLIKEDVSLLNGSSELVETLTIPEEKLVVQRNFKTLIAHEHEKHFKEENPRRKKSSVLVMFHNKKKLDANFVKTNGLISVVKKKTTISEDLPEILTNLRELDSDSYLHDFPPMRDKADEILYLEENLRTSS